MIVIAEREITSDPVEGVIGETVERDDRIGMWKVQELL